MAQPYTPPSPPRMPPGPRNRAATIGFVWALMGAVLAIVPLLGVVAWVLSPVGLVLSVVGLGMATRREGRGRGLAIAGTILGVVGLALCVLWASVVVSAFSSVTSAPTAPYTPPPAPAALDRTAGPLTLEVTATAPTADVIRTGDGARTMTREQLPFRATIPAPPTATVSLVASLSSDNGGAPPDADPGPITCTISQAGRVVTTTTATGPYPTAVCTAW